MNPIFQSRLMGEGDEGRVVRNSMVEALWVDCDTRAKVRFIKALE